MNGKIRMSPNAISKVDNVVHADHVVLFGVLDKADHECTSRFLEKELTMS